MCRAAAVGMKDADHTGGELWGLQPVAGVVTPQWVLPVSVPDR